LEEVPASVDLDLGLDDVAKQAAAEPRKRRQSAPLVMPGTGTESTSEVEALKAERDRLQKELEALRNRPSVRADGAAGSGTSREREFLNLREIINKKEKEILNLRDTCDAKERQILDVRDQLSELEQRAQNLDARFQESERKLASARDRINTLQTE